MDASVTIDVINAIPDHYYPVFVLDGSGTGFEYIPLRLLDEGQGEEVLVRLADDWSEPVMEAVLRANGVEAARQWPKCPRHPHALNPKLIDGTACWSCDFEETLKFPIGQMPTSAEVR